MIGVGCNFVEIAGGFSQFCVDGEEILVKHIKRLQNIHFVVCFDNHSCAHGFAGRHLGRRYPFAAFLTIEDRVKLSRGLCPIAENCKRENRQTADQQHCRKQNRDRFFEHFHAAGFSPFLWKFIFFGNCLPLFPTEGVICD